MIAAILCPGPSLAGLARPAADVLIAVNRAGLAFSGCDVWAAVDLPLCLEIAPRVTAKAWLTNRETLHSCWRRGLPVMEGQVYVTDDLLAFCPGSIGWTLYTTTAAIVLAVKLGATDVRLYGADMAGTGGIGAGEDRSDARWERERVILGKLTEWCQGREVKVSRLLPSHSQ